MASAEEKVCLGETRSKKSKDAIAKRTVMFNVCPVERKAS